MATKTAPRLESSPTEAEGPSPAAEEGKPAPGPAQEQTAVNLSPAPASGYPVDPRWAALAAPFAADQIEKLPKGNTLLDYVGHAGITMRLNEAVGPENWSFEPMAYTSAGLPLVEDGILWGKLTILGVTKICVGDAAGKKGANAYKEMIGDAIRNGAMRFGVATYLWSKSEAAEAIKERELAAQVQTNPKPTNGNGANGNGKHPAAARAAAAQQTTGDPTASLKLDITRLLCDLVGVRNDDGSWDMESTMWHAEQFLPAANHDQRGMVPLKEDGTADLKAADETRLKAIKVWLRKQIEMRSAEPGF